MSYGAAILATIPRICGLADPTMAVTPYSKSSQIIQKGM